MRVFWLLVATGLSGCVTAAENTFADEHREKVAPAAVGRLEGRVYEFLDPDQPLRGARVRIADRSTTTDADGVFIFEGLHDGEHDLELSLVGHRAVSEPVTLPHPEVLRRGLHSTGQILTELPTGADFKATLLLHRDGVDETQHNGELLDGTYQVALELEHVGENHWRRTAEVEVDLVEGQQRKVDFRFAPPLTISGEVRDAKKKPVAGARVLGSKVFEHNSLLKLASDSSVGLLEESRCVTDAFGRFTLEGLESGSYHLLAYAPDQPAISLDAEAGDQAVKFSLMIAPEKK